MKRLSIIAGIIMFILLIPIFSQAKDTQNVSFQRQVLEQLTQLKIQMAKLSAKLEEGHKALNQRIDDLNQRIDDMNQRIDDLRSELKGDIGDLRGLVYVVLTGMIALVGFVLWDRRTAITSVVRRTGELEKEFDEEKHNVMKVFKEYAKVEPRFAEVLKSVGML
jgi:predicted PurR-regulated permease PerM